MEKIVGKVVMGDLGSVQPNPWNPNEMDEFTFKSLVHGFETEGWLVSQSLLIWRKDDHGELRNLIIDGEQRWTAANQLGMKRGPMVFLDGLTEAQAKALTIKLDQKRGSFNRDRLSTLVSELLANQDATLVGLDLGLNHKELARLASTPAIPLRSENVHTKQVPLYFDAKQHAEFDTLVKKLSARFQTDNVTDTVLAAFRELARPKNESVKKASKKARANA